MRKSAGLNNEELILFISLISSQIKLVPRCEFKQCLSMAEDITPDPDDSEYFALALRYNFPIRSNDKKLKNQDKVKVYSTKEIIKLV